MFVEVADEQVSADWPLESVSIGGALTGDLIVISTPGHAPRRGRISAVYGAAQHRHFDVRWGANRSSLLYPDPDRTQILRQG